MYRNVETGQCRRRGCHLLVLSDYDDRVKYLMYHRVSFIRKDFYLADFR